MKRKKNRLNLLSQESLLTFIKMTKEGKYAKIDKKTLAYPRVKEEREDPYYEEQYYYSLT